MIGVLFFLFAFGVAIGLAVRIAKWNNTHDKRYKHEYKALYWDYMAKKESADHTT